MAGKSWGLELYEPESESTMLTETVIGSHRFRVEGYSFNKGIGIGKWLTSATFTIGGFNWAIKYYLDGFTEETKDYLACFLKLRSEATVKASFRISLLDQNIIPSEMSPSELSLPSPETFNLKSRTWGYIKFVERKSFEASRCLKDNSFVLNCVVRVIKPSCLKSKFEPVVVPPSDFDKQLHCLLASGEGADVSVEVGGEIFRAHKLVLGMRSRVFHAHFFGQMKEKHAERIKLDDIEAEVFRVFLDFTYSDSISKLEEAIDDGDKHDAIIMYQHLLVVADRYGVERLKLICENALSKNLDVNNLATILTLAEQHNCPRLKASCFKFVASPNNLIAVMRTEEFAHLIQSCPNILKELAVSTSSNENRGICTFSSVVIGFSLRFFFLVCAVCLSCYLVYVMFKLARLGFI